MTLATLAFVPSGKPRETATSRGLPKRSGDLIRLVLAAFLMGFASTAVWSFGGELLARSLDWTGQEVGLLWIVIGAAGAAGAFAGSLVSRFGLNAVHVVSLLAVSAGVVCVGVSGTMPSVAFGGGILFGAAYIMLTGVYLVWGISALPERPATGLTIAFLTIAVGQTVGAPIFGILIERTTPDVAVTVFAALGLLASFSGRRCVAGSASCA